MDIGKLRAQIEKEESLADIQIDGLIAKANSLSNYLKQFKKLDKEYRKIEFRLDPGA